MNSFIEDQELTNVKKNFKEIRAIKATWNFRNKFRTLCGSNIAHIIIDDLDKLKVKRQELQQNLKALKNITIIEEES